MALNTIGKIILANAVISENFGEKVKLLPISTKENMKRAIWLLRENIIRAILDNDGDIEDTLATIEAETEQFPVSSAIWLAKSHNSGSAYDSFEDEAGVRAEGVLFPLAPCKTESDLDELFEEAFYSYLSSTDRKEVLQVLADNSTTSWWKKQLSRIYLDNYPEDTHLYRLGGAKAILDSLGWEQKKHPRWLEYFSYNGEAEQPTPEASREQAKEEKAQLARESEWLREGVI